MKVYKFIFVVGFLNLVIPFFGVPFIYKNYALLGLAVITIAYALIVRAVEKERENHSIQIKNAQAPTQTKTPTEQSVSNKKIEDVVEMVETKERVAVSDVVPKKRGRKPKAITQEIYE